MVDFNDKQYQGALLLDELVEAGIAPTDVRVLTNGRAVNCRVEILVEDSDSAIENTIISVAAAHDASVVTDGDKATEAIQAVANGKHFLRRQLLNPSPDAAAIYSTIRSAVDSNIYLSQIVNNQIALMEAAHGWTLDLDTPTVTDRLRYILVVEAVIALLT